RADLPEGRDARAARHLRATADPFGHARLDLLRSRPPLADLRSRAQAELWCAWPRGQTPAAAGRRGSEARARRAAVPPATQVDAPTRCGRAARCARAIADEPGPR